MRSMLAALEGSAEVSTVSLGLSFQILATSLYKLRLAILRVDVASMDRYPSESTAASNKQSLQMASVQFES